MRYFVKYHIPNWGFNTETVEAGTRELATSTVMDGIKMRHPKAEHVQTLDIDEEKRRKDRNRAAADELEKMDQ